MPDPQPLNGKDAGRRVPWNTFIADLRQLGQAAHGAIFCSIPKHSKMIGNGMGDSSRKLWLYERFARVGQALANPVRLELLDLLAQGERSVEELAGTAGLKVSNTSAQLKTLTSAGMLASRRSGTRVYYRLADDQVGEFVEQLKRLAVTWLPDAEIAAQDYLGDVTALAPIALDELVRRLDENDVIVVDVRPAAEYAAGHIPGAINMPHDQVAARLTELPPRADIVAYCRGRYCVFAPEAVRLLRDHGRYAQPLDGGLPEWRRAGLPVCLGAP